MGRSILKYLVLILLVVAVFFAAKYLDSNPKTVVVDPQPEQTPGHMENVEIHESPYQETIGTTAPEVTEPETTEGTKATEAAEPTEATAAETEPQQRYVLTFAGDCTLSGPPGLLTAEDGFVTVVGEDYQYPLRNISSWFIRDDFTMVNLECVLADSGFPVVKDYPFRGDEAYIGILSGSSVESVSLANNHTMDYGADGYATTCSVLEDAGISYVERDKSRLITLDGGLTIGVYAAVYYNLNTAVIQKGIADLRSAGADIVVFAAHWGYDGNYKPRAEETKLAHAAIDAGADIVYGTHPHVLQPIETYKDGVIFYSLGNLCYGGNIYIKDMDTALVQVEIVVEEDGSASVDKWTAIPCSISSAEDRNNYQPTPYASNSEGYQRVMSKLDGSWEKIYVDN